MQKYIGSALSFIISIIYTKNIGNKWKNHFFKMKGDIGMGWSSKKEGNKKWLLSKATQNYMTPSLYLCLCDSTHTFNEKYEEVHAMCILEELQEGKRLE